MASSVLNVADNLVQVASYIRGSDCGLF